MGDRRRVNGPADDIAPPNFVLSLKDAVNPRSQRTRTAKEIRKIFLKTGLTPSASGSAYLELEPSSVIAISAESLIKPSSALKLSCTIHGPRPLPRSASFTPQLLLSTHVKYAPFASRQRRGYVRDSSERDLAVHLETALRGAIISERWPKSGLDVIITILECDEDSSVIRGISKKEEYGWSEGWGIMSILSGCVTVASAALADSGIDCADFVTGGIAALVRQPSTDDTAAQCKPKSAQPRPGNSTVLVKDPCSTDHREILAACVVGYLQSRDEITEIWVKGDVTKPLDQEASNSTILDALTDQAIEVAMATRMVLAEAIKESTELKTKRSKPIQL